MKRRHSALMLGAALAVAGIAACADMVSRPAADDGMTGVFYCEMDGQLSETHVGVEKAELFTRGSYRLEYKEGHSVQYFPFPGETCQLVQLESALLKPQPKEISL